jgi:dTDP-4-amino-4,6-dideoxygalactose transaminase
LAHRYHELFSDMSGIVVPQEATWTKGVYHLYVVRVAERQALQAHLAAVGVGTGIHYPIPLHLQKAYQYLGYKAGDFPAAERVASEILSLPMFPHLSHGQQDAVVMKTKEFLSSTLAAINVS